MYLTKKRSDIYAFKNHPISGYDFDDCDLIIGPPFAEFIYDMYTTISVGTCDNIPRLNT